MQDALAKAWASQATFDPAHDELAWLIAVADSVISDYFKSLKTEKREPASGQKVPRGDGRFAIGPTLDAASRTAVAPLKEIIDAEEIAGLHAAIAKLDSSKRQAIEFRQAGLSYREIATRMGVKNGTVGSLINRAVKELQELLQIQLNDPDGA
jgi:RNA polymerase sigma factor (sigma-70 family)